MFTVPLLGWRRVEVTEQRTREDWAYQVKKLVDEDFPEAEKIVLVMDNLNTASIGSLYEAFPPGEAKGIKDKVEIHYRPKQGSWLNKAEIEMNVINNQGLSARIATIEQMRKEAAAWNLRRNKEASKIDWRFTTADARIKLKRLYPRFE
jgi:hypothetical protein